MKKPQETAPQVVKKTKDDFGTTAEWEADLVERITSHLSWVINHPSYEGKYELDQDVDLKNMEQGRLESLLLGKSCEVEDFDFDSDYTHEQDVLVIRDESTDVFKLFMDEIEEFAEETNQDSEDLQDEWLDSDEFTPGEMECQVHYNNFNYTGEVSARVSLDFNLTLDATGDDLWEALHFFKINASDFLSVAQREIDNATIDSNGMLDEASSEELAKWSIILGDIDDSGEDDNDENQKTAKEIYTEEFVSRQEQIESNRLFSCNRWGQNESLISVIDLINYVKEHSYGRDNKIETYIHFGLDQETEKTFSRRCSMHGFYSDDMDVILVGGYLSSEKSPGYSKDYVGNISFVNPVEINISSIVLDKDKKPDYGCDTLLMEPDFELYADLYQEIIQKRSEISSMDLDEIEEKGLIDKCLLMLEDKSSIVIKKALTHGELPAFKKHAEEFLKKTTSILHQDELDRALISIIETLPVNSIKKSIADEIKLLIKMGASGDFENTVGANSFQVASKKLLPLEILNEIANATSNKNLEFSNQGNALSIAIKSMSSRGVTYRENELEKNVERLTWYFDKGIYLTENALSYPKPGDLRNLLDIDEGVVVVMALEKLQKISSPEEIQKIKDKIFYNAALEGRDQLAGKMVASGAKVDAVSKTINGGLSIEEAIDKHAVKRTWDKEFPARIDSIKTMARSMRLRGSAMSLIEEMENDSPSPVSIRP